MANFLKVVSGIYLIFVWLVFVLMATTPAANAYVGSGGSIIAFAAAIGLSIPAAIIYAFGQIVGDIRQMRDDARVSLNNIRVMRRYYEPDDNRQISPH